MREAVILPDFFDSPSNNRRLLVSIHDVGPAFKFQVQQLAERLTTSLGGELFSMLVVPNHWGRHPLGEDRAFCSQLRAWSDAGVEMFLHGWFHRDDARHAGLHRWKASQLTAGEGEFLGLSCDIAAARMAAGRALLEDITGRAVAGFVAPAWLYGEGAREALATSGFPMVEDHLRVWRPDNGQTLAWSPVVTWASRTSLRTASSLVFAGLAKFALQPLRTVRVAVHPGDVSKPELLSSIDRTLAAFLARRDPARYCSLLS